MQRGEIWHVDLAPTRGREQANARYVLVVTEKIFNDLGTPIVAPITTGANFSRLHGFAVSLSGAGTRSVGVVLRNQLRAVDLKARGGRYVERAPDFVVNEVLQRASTLFD